MNTAEERPIYTGPINYDKMPRYLRAAAMSFYTQRYRCLNPKAPQFKHYGAKGIEVRYTAREFIGWWDQEYKKKESWTKATVSRIDHDGHYEFSNIKLEEVSINVSERNRRVRTSSLKRRVLAIHPDGRQDLFASVAECSSHFNIARRSLLDLLVSRYGKDTRDGVKFQYYQGGS